MALSCAAINKFLDKLINLHFLIDKHFTSGNYIIEIEDRLEGIEGPEFQTASSGSEKQVFRVGKAKGKDALSICNWDFPHLSEKERN
jgi:hypothetical protein